MVKSSGAVPKAEVPDDYPAPLADYFFHMLFVAARSHDASLDKMVRQFRVDVPGARAIVVIHRLGTCTMGELADYCVTDRTTMTRIVDHLVSAGLVERQKPREDRRQVQLSLTPSGKQVYAEGSHQVEAKHRALLAGLSESDVRLATELLVRISGRMVEDPIMLERVRWTRQERSSKPVTGATAALRPTR